MARNKFKIIFSHLFFAIALSLCCFSTASAELSYGDVGNDVLVVQQYLHRIGYDLEETGVFSDQLLETLYRYQHAHFLPETGVVDDATMLLMFGQESIPSNYLAGRGKEWFPILLLKVAQQYLGVPYVWGGTTPDGFDCSGYVQYVFRECGVTLPRLADEQFNYGWPVEKDRLIPGDLVFFETYEPGPSHIGIYFNSTYFIHADSASGEIAFDTLERAYREETYLGARRMVFW